MPLLGSEMGFHRRLLYTIERTPHVKDTSPARAWEAKTRSPVATEPENGAQGCNSDATLASQTDGPSPDLGTIVLLLLPLVFCLRLLLRPVPFPTPAPALASAAALAPAFALLPLCPCPFALDLALASTPAPSLVKPSREASYQMGHPVTG